MPDVWWDMTETQSAADREAAARAVLDLVAGSDPLAPPPAGKVLMVGDVHGSEPHLLRLVQRAADAGLPTVVQLGDTFGTHRLRSLRTLEAVSRACVEHGVTFLWLEGNHDRHVGLLDRLPTHPDSGLHPCRPGIWHLPRGASWTWQGCRWTAAGGAVSVDAAVRTFGEDWWIEEELTDADVDRIATAVHRTDVLLTHDRPAWVEAALGQTPGAWWLNMPRSWSETDFRRSQAHQQRLDRLVAALRPKLHLHGHLHRRYDFVSDASPWGERTRVSGLAHEPMAGNTLVVPCAPDFDRLLATTGADGDAR